MPLLGTALAVGSAAVATGAESSATVQAGDLLPIFNAGVLPTTLPRHTMAPLAIRIDGGFVLRNEPQSPTLREATIDFDKDGVVDATGLPVCRRAQLETLDAGNARRTCGKAIVGTGTANVAIASLQSGPIPIPLTLFNGGARGGTTTLFIDGVIPSSSPTPIVATVKLREIHEGPYGLQAITKIPPIADGNGSLLTVGIKVKRLFTYKGMKQSFAKARCSDGHLSARFNAVFGHGEGFSEETVVRACEAIG